MKIEHKFFIYLLNSYYLSDFSELLDYKFTYQYQFYKWTRIMHLNFI